ncbi:hypothetical protein CYQ88_08400 [Hydrogenovibrio sp. SC-1]|uniref:DUF3800 domain-containing protein n=1 Tax=Hydrogenovibrio sp. SC-1 TaxID=2065820 RepID=UPI000C7DFCC9|nr:DUF3800 domain-containing protein [Hydrogenovibrio sp. SC-1]PLA73975.1 hypothetical protein CYQ88_08400 [Hydrogenovibrio sp. SC-1]
MDESGNSGAQLLDIDQPVFSLASNCFDEHQTTELIDLLKSSQTNGEIKFSSLKSSKAGKQRLIDFFSSGLINENFVKVSIFHKEYMVVTKVVDMLVETWAHENGTDLYQDGANIALSNMLFYCLPVFCSQESFNQFIASFIKMVRMRDEQSISEYYSSAEKLYDACSDEEFKKYLALFKSYPRKLLNVALSSEGSFSLDPAIPALFNHCCAWGEVTDDFLVIHDESKPIQSSLEIFHRLMDQGQMSVEVGYDRRKFSLPLKSRGITLADSKSTFQVQVSDVIAGSVNYCAKSLLNGQENDLTDIIQETLFKDGLMLSPIWPTPHVTPQELQTIGGGGFNPVDAITTLLQEG